MQYIYIFFCGSQFFFLLFERGHGTTLIRFVLWKKNIHVIPFTLILATQMLQCVAECCMRRIAMYACNPAHMHACYQKYFSVMQCGVVCCGSVMRCVAVCCTRRIATYSCDPMHAYACYQRCSSVMQCDAACFRNLIQLGGVCCTRRRAPYACNPTHAHGCYPKLPCHQPPRFPRFLSTRVCLRLHVCVHVYSRLCGCWCAGVGLGVCMREGGGGGSQALAEWPYWLHPPRTHNHI